MFKRNMNSALLTGSNTNMKKQTATTYTTGFNRGSAVRAQANILNNSYGVGPESASSNFMDHSNTNPLTGFPHQVQDSADSGSPEITGAAEGGLIDLPPDVQNANKLA